MPLPYAATMLPPTSTVTSFALPVFLNLEKEQMWYQPSILAVQVPLLKVSSLSAVAPSAM